MDREQEEYERAKKWQMMGGKPEIVRIIPAEASKDGLVQTQGTRVIVGQQEVRNITKIVLTAKVNDIWTAEIHCHVNIQAMDAFAMIHYPQPWWRCFVNWLLATPEDLN